MAKSQSSDKITSGVVIILILLGFTVIAGFNDKLGKVMTMVMVGFGFTWFLTSGAPLLRQWFAGVGTSSQPSNAPVARFPGGATTGLKAV